MSSCLRKQPEGTEWEQSGNRVQMFAFAAASGEHTHIPFLHDVPGDCGTKL